MNIYELLKNNNENITPEIACIDISLKTFVILGKINDEQRIDFLKSIYCYEKINSTLNKYNNFIRDIK